MFGIALLFSTVIAAPLPACQQISVWSYSLEPGKAVFEAYVPTKASTFKWTVSGGTIVSGQGSDRIEVTGVAGEPVTGAIEVGPVAKGCEAKAAQSLKFSDGKMGACPKLLIWSTPEKKSGWTKVSAIYLPLYPARWNWTVSDGTVVRGQNTGNVVVEAEAGHTVTATVEAGITPDGCPNVASETFDVK